MLIVLCRHYRALREATGRKKGVFLIFFYWGESVKCCFSY